ncbi:hypothetical protein [Cryobacterium tepidiphilum]|uniref:hypothetical protein n=1 Tax=Cryobacterium tepidiphilum TaxID=2486026 RepID=UPI0018F60096|nr:hypothetical protein [Cryobacterium tepidiphilum]
MLSTGTTDAPTLATRVLGGLAAGAAATTALNLATYLDMTVRGRPASQMPAKTAADLAHKAGIDLGEGSTADNRKTGLGAVMGIATGITVGVGYALLIGGRRPPLALAGAGIGLGAMAMGDGPMTMLGLTDPRSWKPVEWAADIVPHLVFGLVAASTYRRFRNR